MIWHIFYRIPNMGLEVGTIIGQGAALAVDLGNQCEQ